MRCISFVILPGTCLQQAHGGASRKLAPVRISPQRALSRFGARTVPGATQHPHTVRRSVPVAALCGGNGVRIIQGHAKRRARRVRRSGGFLLPHGAQDRGCVLSLRMAGTISLWDRRGRRGGERGSCRPARSLARPVPPSPALPVGVEEGGLRNEIHGVRVPGRNGGSTIPMPVRTNSRGPRPACPHLTHLPPGHQVPLPGRVRPERAVPGAVGPNHDARRRPAAELLRPRVLPPRRQRHSPAIPSR